ncbi:MAG: response regulator, partial [Thermoanaerobaculia bacterium]|nr:response regulator [Thermoanaerobaculia bacterium]
MSLRLLLVDDSEEESSTIRNEAPNDLDVTWTEEAVEACRMLAERNYDLVLLDLTLPDEWGLDGLVRVSTVAPETPILALGVPGDEELGRHAVMAGAAGFAMKSEMTAEAIGSIVEETLRDHETDVTEEHRRRDPESGFYEREAFLKLAQRRLRLASVAGKGAILLVAEMISSGDRLDPDRISSAAEALRLTFRRSDLVGRIGRTRFAAIGLVHPSDDSETIVSQRLDEVVQTRNTTVDHDDPIELGWNV